jgi:hypothetical protein
MEFFKAETDEANLLECTYLVVGVIYCCIALQNQKTKKFVFLNKFAPPNGAERRPDFSKISAFYYEIFETFKLLKKEEFVHHWASKSGCRFAPHNLPSSDPNFGNGVWVGDLIRFTAFKEGIYPRPEFGKPPVMIEGSELTALSVDFEINQNGTILGNFFGILTDGLMGQKALDVLYICKIGGKYYVKIAERGSGSTVDLPNTIVPGAGEHINAGTPSPKASIQAALHEELGVDSTWSKFYSLYVGKYDNPGRDPRYWTWEVPHDGSFVTVGAKRASETDLWVIYCSSDKLSEKGKHSDETEIKSTRWIDLETLELAPGLKLSPEMMMLHEHFRLFGDALEAVKAFSALSEEEKAIRGQRFFFS